MVKRLVIGLFFVLFLIGCSSSSDVVYEYEDDSTVSKLAFDESEKLVGTVDYESEINFSDFEVDSKEDFELIYKEEMDYEIDYFESVDGIEYDYEVLDDAVRIIVVLDYSEFEPDEYDGLPLTFTSSNDDGLTVEELKEQIKETGFEKVE